MAVSAVLVMEALGDQSRRAILEHLAGGPKPVGELAKVLPISRPAVSQHLKVLKAAKLVEAEAIGTRHLYRVNRAGLDALRDYLDRFWKQALANLAAVAESDEDG